MFFSDGGFKKLMLAEDLSVCIYICLSHVYSFFSLVFFFKTLGLRESVAVSSVFFQQLYLMLNHFRAACMATWNTTSCCLSVSEATDVQMYRRCYLLKPYFTTRVLGLLQAVCCSSDPQFTSSAITKNTQEVKSCILWNVTGSLFSPMAPVECPIKLLDGN